MWNQKFWLPAVLTKVCEWSQFHVSGAPLTPYTAGQYSVFTAFLEQGDEVIMFEPFFDQYLPSVTFNGGKPVYVPLHPPVGDKLSSSSSEWTIDVEELRYEHLICSMIGGTLNPLFQTSYLPKNQDDHRQHPPQPSGQGVHEEGVGGYCFYRRGVQSPRHG